MKAVILDDLNLKRIAESGQCFRWKNVSGNRWRVISGQKIVYMEQVSDGLLLSCSEEEFETYWSVYLDLQTGYRQIRESIPESDTWMSRAAEQQSGIRILRQDSWEMIISFIISQRKSIPAIRNCIEKLCQNAGKELGTYDKEVCYGFPGPDEILSSEKLADCGLGYRLPYVMDAARYAQKQNLTNLQKLTDEELKQELMTIKGIGKKVADCILLFGFHRMNAFPVDVWMDRALQAHYPEGFSVQNYAPWAGLMQQYLFMQERFLAKQANDSDDMP